jgi:hypothetical protein
MNTAEKVSNAIAQIIDSMMNRVMDNVLINDPFIPEEHNLLFKHLYYTKHCSC